MEDPLKRSTAQDNAPTVSVTETQTVEFRVESESQGNLLSWMKNLLPGGSRNGEDSLRNVIEELIDEDDSSATSSVAVHERKLISNILQLRDLPVLEVMVPRADIVAINIDSDKEELLRILAQTPHSRIPVYKDDLDNIVGVINMKDLVAQIAANRTDFSLREIMRDPYVVSPAMRVMDLLLHMRQSKNHIAFVVDEFGGIDGLISINDLVEAIVGEIDDEYDFELTPQLVERPDGSAIADGRFPVREFENRYGNIFTEDDEHEEVDTIGGLVSYISGHMPARGEIIRHASGVEFEVIDADPRRILRVRIRNIPQKEPTPEN